MQVKCISTYEDVMVGDTGHVMKIENEGLHDLNVRVRILVIRFCTHASIILIRWVILVCLMLRIAEEHSLTCSAPEKNCFNIIFFSLLE